jgi:flavin-dependent dehydrogenase
MFDFDAVVVGCGPAGLMATKELASRGVKVLGVDKKPRLDVNTRTASGFFFADQELNGEVIRLEPLKNKTKIHFTKCGFSIGYSAPMEGIHHSYMISNTGRQFKTTSRKVPIFNIFEPTRWLADRYRDAKKAGASFMANALAMRAKNIEGGVELTLRRQGKISKINCRKLIASDGLQSKIVRNLGQNKKRMHFATGPVIEYEITNVETGLDRGDCIVFGERNVGKPGGLFIIPSSRGEKAYRFETMSMMPGSNAYEMMEFFMNEGPFAHWFKKAKVVDKTGAIVELFTPIRVPYEGNIIFVSDAAAFAECLYQGATMCGYMAGVATEKELRGKKGFEEYTKWWDASFEWNRNPQRMADYAKKTMFYAFFGSEVVDYLFDLALQKPPVGDDMRGNPFSFGNHVLDYYLSNFPNIRKDVAAKLKLFRDGDMASWVSVMEESLL